MRKKVCRACKQEKRLIRDFHKRTDSPDGYNFICKVCNQEQVRNSKGRAEWLMRYHLKKCTGLSWEQYEGLLEAQSGKCAICGSENPGRVGSKFKRFHVDHCHQTETIRGLLCTQCNTALGLFYDDPTILHNAIQYLKRGGMIKDE